jgi:hypothetical protein
MSYELHLYKDEIAPAAAVTLPARAHSVEAIYVVAGGLRVATAALIAACGVNSALHATGAAQISGSNLPTVALRWWLAAAGASPAALTGAGVSSTALLTAPLELDRNMPYLLRCDRVDFPPQGEALLHTHQGGGIRCLLFGGIEIETKGARYRYGPLGAWFEAGSDPVYAGTSPTGPSAFVRLMILPRALLGKSSISYVNAGDQDKPKSQRYQVFIDAPIELPR